jgi:hypothetical protein
MRLDCVANMVTLRCCAVAVTVYRYGDGLLTVAVTVTRPLDPSGRRRGIAMIEGRLGRTFAPAKAASTSQRHGIAWENRLRESSKLSS